MKKKKKERDKRKKDCKTRKIKSNIKKTECVEEKHGKEEWNEEIPWGSREREKERERERERGMGGKNKSQIMKK